MLVWKIIAILAPKLVNHSLLAQGFKTPHYWTLQGNKAEVDFLIQNGLEIIPIEVKAEDNMIFPFTFIFLT